MKHNVLVLGSSSGVAPAERREAERSEVDRSGAGATPDARVAVTPARPDPEVVVDAKRRTFTAEYKQRVLAAADVAAAHGSIGALLRREGLYSSHLVTWRRERRAGILKGLTPRTRGPKATRRHRCRSRYGAKGAARVDKDPRSVRPRTCDAGRCSGR